MSIIVQEAFGRLSFEKTDPMWLGKQNAWIRGLAPVHIGAVGEQLALSVLGGEQSPNNRSGFDIQRNEEKIEVKLSTVVLMSSGRSPTLCWRQIRPTDPYTHICFIAVYPEDVRMFLVPKEDIPRTALIKQHGRGEGFEIFQISTSQIDSLFPWMLRHEIT